MAATLPPLKTKEKVKPTGGGRNPGGGSWGGDGGGGGEPERTPPPDSYRIGVWLALSSISMMFLALTSAYIVNQARYRPIETPSILWLSTTVILVSSSTLELARRTLKRRAERAFNQWLVVTIALGVLFLALQLVAWRQLVSSGFYVNTNQHSGYAYMLTALHGLHLIGGVLALAYLLVRNRWFWTAVRRRVSVDATAVYWHFLSGLWLFIFILIFVWR